MMGAKALCGFESHAFRLGRYPNGEGTASKTVGLNGLAGSNPASSAQRQWASVSLAWFVIDEQRCYISQIKRNPWRPLYIPVV